MKIQIDSVVLSRTKQLLKQALCPDCICDGNQDAEELGGCDWCEYRAELLRSIETVGA